MSGQVVVADGDKPADSKFFGKLVAIQEMIAELRDMVGAVALKIVPEINAVSGAQEGSLVAENDSLRLLLEQAVINAQVLLEPAGIEAREREAASKLQSLIRDELHHRIKNTLATVSAIAAQSLRTATSIEHGQQAIESRFAALGRAHDLLMQTSWADASLTETVRSATQPFDNQGTGRFRFSGPEIKITSGAVIALAMTFNELCTNYNEVRRAFCSRWTCRNHVDHRSRTSQAPTRLDRRRRPDRQEPNSAQFRQSAHGDLRSSITWRSSAPV